MVNRRPKSVRGRRATPGRAAPSPALVHDMAAAALEGFEPMSVYAVLHAAGSSPTAMHRVPSLAAMLVGTIARPPRGVRPAGPADLSGWLAALSIVEPAYVEAEDWLPVDPRELIRVQFGSGLWPVHPGLMARPQEVVTRALRYADSADSILRPHLGFGIADLVELALRIMAADRAALSPHWTDPPATDPAAPATVNPAEVTAATGLLEAWRAVDLTTTLPEALFSATPAGGDQSPDGAHREHLVRALHWSAPKPGMTRLPFGHEHELLSAFVVPTKHGVIPVPAGLILPALATLTDNLLAEAARLDAAQHRGERSWDGVVAGLRAAARDRVEDSLRALPAHIVSAATLDTVNSNPVALVAPAARHVVALEVAAAATPSTVATATNRAARHLRHVVPGSCVRPMPGVALGDHENGPSASPDGLRSDVPFDMAVLRGAPGALQPDVAVTRVIIVDGPSRPSLRVARGVAVMALDEWCALVGEIDDAEELWAFLDELSGQPGVGELAAWTVRDLWTVFRKFGLFSPATDRKNTVVVPPGDPTEEERGESRSRLDDVLIRLGLPAVADWPRRSLREEDGSAALAMLHPCRLLFVGPALPVAVLLTEPEPGTSRSLAVTLAAAVFDGIQALAAGTSTTSSNAWCDLVGDRPVIVTIMMVHEVPGNDPVRFVALTEREIVLMCGQRAVSHATNRAVQDSLGDALAQGAVAYATVAGLPTPPDAGTPDEPARLTASPQLQQAQQAFMTAWRAVPDLLNKVVQASPFAADTTFAASRLTRTGQARAARLVAGELRRQRTPPGEFTGDAAVALLRTVVGPAIMKVLTDQLRQFEPEQALVAATQHLERLWADRREHDARQALRLATQADQTDSLNDLDGARDAVAWRAGTLIVEMLLRTPPTGTSRLDSRDWIQLHHLAAYAIELAEQSTAGAMGLYRLTVTVDESGVVLLDHDQVTLDLPAYLYARQITHLRELTAELRVDLPAFEDEIAAADPSASLPFHSIRQALHTSAQQTRRGRDGLRRMALGALAVDEAMRTLGAGVDGISAVFATAVSWPVPGEPGALTADADLAEFAATVADWAGLDRVEVTAAVNLLTLSPARLAGELDYWRTEQRDARLGSRPLILLPTRDGHARIRIAPRQVDAARRIFHNYLWAARLPWPHLPPPVNQALSNWAQINQREFEKIVASQTETAGFTHYRPALTPRKAAQHGLAIPGEIDLLLADPARRRIWVVEAKYPNVPYGPGKIYFEIEDFQGGAEPGNLVNGQRRRGGKAYVDTLLAKTRAVRDDVAAALDAVRVNADDGSEYWEVRPLMVTPYPVAAAFVANPRVLFSTPTELADVLDA